MFPLRVNWCFTATICLNQVFFKGFGYGFNDNELGLSLENYALFEYRY